MNRFSRIRHHVSVEDVKKKHLENIAVENFIKIEEEISKTISEKFKHNWRKELEEGMTTSNALSTVLPAEGEVAIDQVSPVDSASFADTNNMFGSNADNPALVDATIRASGSGTGSNNGFNVGGDYLAFQGGSGSSRMALLKPMDATKVDTLTITAIRGTGSNGGEHPDIVGTEELFVIYKTPEMSRSSYLSQDRSQNNIGAFPADAAIIAIDQGDGTLQNYSITIPEYARQKDVIFGLFQLGNSGSQFDHYGVTDIKFQRKTPINVVVPLDSPEAISFVRVGTNEGDPKKRKKKVNDQLAASDEYTTKQLGDQFPGQGARLGDEASSAGAPDPFSSASIQEPDASPIGKGEVTKSFANFSTSAAAAQPEAEPQAEPTTPSSQTTMNPTNDEGEEINVKPVGDIAVQGADAADVDAQNDQDDAQDDAQEPETTETELDPEEIKASEEEKEGKTEEEIEEIEKEKYEAEEQKQVNKILDSLLNFAKQIDPLDMPIDLGINVAIGIINLGKGINQIRSFLKKISGGRFGAGGPLGDPDIKLQDEKYQKFFNNIEIMRSNLTGRITTQEYNSKQISDLANTLNIAKFTGTNFYDAIGGSYGISDVRHEYVDDNIYVKDGKVYTNDQGLKSLANMETGARSVDGIGKGYGQMIIPKDGSKPYFHFYDYNYHNLNSESPDELPPGFMTAFGAKTAQVLRSFLPGRIFDDVINRIQGNLNTFGKNLKTRVGLDGWPPGIHGATLTDFKIPLDQLPEETQEMIANHPLSWTPERIANMSEDDYYDEIFKRSERFEDDDYILKSMEDPDSGVDPEFLKNFKRFDFYTKYDENTRTHPDAKEGTVQYDYDRAVEELNKIVDSPEYSAASQAAFKEYEDVLAERDEKIDKVGEKYDTSKLYEKLVGPYYRAVMRVINSGGSIEYNNPTYQKMVNGHKEYEKQSKVYERKLSAERSALMDEYGKLSDEAIARYNDTNRVIKLDDGTMGLINGGDFKTKNGKVIPGMDTLSAKEKARFDEVRLEYEEVQNYLYSDAANFMDNIYKPFVLYDVKTQFAKYGVSGDSWTPKNPKGSESKSDPSPDPSFTGSAGSFVGGDATAAATAAAETNRKKKKNNESLEYFANPHGGVTLYEKLKARGFFNPKDIKPTFPENDPPEIDKKTGMHPNYGKQAKRYNKLDPISANSMPPTGDPEIDVVVDKQRTKKKPSERKQDYIKTVDKIKKMAKKS